MSKTSIEWTETAGRARGSLKTAARRLGVGFDEYQRRKQAGEKHCRICRTWKPATDFATDRSRGDGRASACRACASRCARSAYVPRTKVIRRGRRYVEARTADRRQARRRVNHLVDLGLLPRPNDVPCTDCGHTWKAGERRHEYDHHLGYAAEHHEHVEAVCTTCHRRRERDRHAN